MKTLLQSVPASDNDQQQVLCEVPKSGTSCPLSPRISHFDLACPAPSPTALSGATNGKVQPFSSAGRTPRSQNPLHNFRNARMRASAREPHAARRFTHRQASGLREMRLHGAEKTLGLHPSPQFMAEESERRVSSPAATFAKGEHREHNHSQTL